MDISESESVSADSKVTTEVLPETPEDPLELDNATSSSEKQQYSIFSLTIDEIQTRSGRSFGSMNMDEFLNSVWSDHEFQASSSVNDVEAAANNDNGTYVEQTNLRRQGSLPVQLPTPLCGKTVDEVWAEIQQNNESQLTDDHSHAFSEFMASSEALQLQTLGEMTLEEFLVKAGVIREASNNPSQQENLSQNSLSGSYFSNSSCLETNTAGQQVMGFEFSTQSNCVGNGNGTTLLSNASSVYHHLFTLGSGCSGCLGDQSSNYDIRCGKSNSSPTAGESSNKRKISPTMEVAIERRQRRMIKNRESAARSRARKQAYTAELEIELNQIREENASLKLALEEAEKKLKLHEGGEDDWQGKTQCRTLRKTRSW